MPPLSSTKCRSAFFFAAVVVVACLAFRSVYQIEHAWLADPSIVQDSRAITDADKVDVPILYASLATKPTFASTWAWWHTSWTLTVPFWRPLSIQAFWLEKHFFTLDRIDRWMWLSLTLYVTCSCLLGVFAYLMTRRLAVFALFCDLLAATMFVAAVQNQAHTLHLAAAFQYLLNAIVLVCYGDAVMETIAAQRFFQKRALPSPAISSTS